MLAIMKTRPIVAITLAALLVASLTGCSGGASLDSVAEDCGGSSAGVNVDDSGVMVTIGSTNEALLCMVPKVFSDKSDQYAVAMLADEGIGQSSTIDGREVKTGELGGSAFVFIGAK